MNVERLTPVRSDEIAHEKTRDLLRWLEEHGKDVHMAHLFANATNVFKPYVDMSNALMNRASLSPRLRELAILQLAQRLDAEYEWWEHHRMSQDAGVTLDELDAIESGKLDGAGFGESDRFVLAAADEWVDGSYHLADDTWATGTALLGEAEMRDLVFVLAWWGAWVPAVVRAFQIEVPNT